MAFTGVGTIPGVAIAGYQQHKINQEKDKEISNLRRSTHKGIDQK